MADATSGHPDMLAHALAAAGRGFAVCPGLVPDYVLLIPSRSGLKGPLSAGYRHRATTDVRTIERWFSRFPNANIIARTGRISNLVVLDFDFRFGGRPVSERLRPHLPETLQVTTQNGFHMYYRYPEAMEIPTSIRQVEVGLDVIGEMGSVVMPPSRHIEGSRYRFDDPDVPIGALPDDFAKRCAQVTPQPMFDPHRRGYSATVRDCINLSYAFAATTPHSLRRALRSLVKRP
ncbi:MAG: bifunctional DNA primase/polymerase [Deltaproteobacteria bacterium]|nr:bifunctional DNA primase/polymerase [Deltaproteobacteria bacterium]MBI3386395.1 bifunctional DNA primase/polymerase [Deltaproteobacteria bacterium]